MGKIKGLFKNKSIKTSFAAYIIICILAALLLSILFSNLFQFGQSQLYKKYKITYEGKGIQAEITLGAQHNNNGVLTFYTEDITSLFTASEKLIYNILGFLTIAFVPVCFAICIGITSILFYKRQLQQPLEILDHAADNIAENNLDFTISCDSNNEIGKLCRSFEKMRAALQENNLEMWRQVEERKRLNAAFSHDLRTPLTVLKGQSEMLSKYVPDGKISTDKIVTTVETMRTHIARLENYVSVMNSLQRLEDINIDKNSVAKDEIYERMAETGRTVCVGKEVVFDTIELTNEFVEVDMSVVMQVYENLLTNAVRFSKNRITVTLSSKQNFSIIVSDDGCGFTERDLSEATNPFYKSNGSSDGQHFGIGLNVCKILCEKHGGALLLSNQGGGATVKAVF